MLDCSNCWCVRCTVVGFQPGCQLCRGGCSRSTQISSAVRRSSCRPWTSQVPLAVVYHCSLFRSFSLARRLATTQPVAISRQVKQHHHVSCLAADGPMSEYDEARSPSRTSAASKQLNGSRPQSANFTIGAGVPADVASSYHDSESSLQMPLALHVAITSIGTQVRQPCGDTQAISYRVLSLICSSFHICRPGAAHALHRCVTAGRWRGAHRQRSEVLHGRCLRPP
jgi:hypothetical protein